MFEFVKISVHITSGQFRSGHLSSVQFRSVLFRSGLSRSVQFNSYHLMRISLWNSFYAILKGKGKSKKALPENRLLSYSIVKNCEVPRKSDSL